ncbi:MAG: hypothetical protein UW81_C0004G0021 [Candidatus Giovannonibacteria bacterium GW2011_GWC2_44_9]|uniref:Glycosyltransferase RgtA/B/C/D-like domain-containing protein n=3 Tax=Candidatus Giovannoniibacteriota TaxID=1752738 RepID=A0A0G1IY22_9BACT|nr:MAG: hypothetical protein UW49_C0001G0032 [Candidatus Giovannonibacteria bacterium GW2011_GWB1_44_23]KKT64306.1 MAG: hypothetical protein UW57_C0001G0033 [Candidatus Giovannonibacteria bacterium GW2011_GWA1_44_29]KKT84260.1 MAG: hypothetical protein UW81_C0004G0021 [Candidatus Giovannonibacteria bacterium GW2011_GWC2_44_9]KKT92033.1 MAG: hypothetical protein UW93_C0001G0032 [Parcubacteria group bacterium GW2011_GWC1_45_13]
MDNFKKMLRFAAAHRLILISGLIMVFLIFAPQIFYPLLTEDSYQGINAGDYTVDELQYLAMGKELLEGHGLGNILLREGKNWYNIHQTYVPYFFVEPFKLLGIADKVNVTTVFRGFGFLGTFILILLIYFFTLQLSGNKLLSSAVALFFVGGYILVKLYPAAYLFGVAGAEFNIYSRPVAPLYGMLGIFIYLNLFIKSLKSDKLLHLVGAGISLGILFYIYFYAWTFAYAFTAPLFLIYCLRKDFTQAKKIAIAAFTGLLIGAYVLIQMFLMSQSEIGKQIIFFAHGNYGRTFVFSKISFAALLAPLIFWYRNPKSVNWPILLSFALANWIVLNQQIVTGQSIQPWHYFFNFVIPFAVLVGIYVAHSFIPWDKYKKVFLITLILLAYANTAFQQYRGFQYIAPFKEYAQNYRTIIDALNKDADPGVILASDGLYRVLLTVYTSHDLFWNETVDVFNTPLKRFKEALYVYLFLNKKSRNDFTGYINKLMSPGAPQPSAAYRSIYYDIESYISLESYESGLRFWDYNQKALAGDPYIISLRKIFLTELALEYRRIISKPNGIKNILKEAGVNYIVWDKNKNPEWDLSVISGLKEIVSLNNIYLYQINY